MEIDWNYAIGILDMMQLDEEGWHDFRLFDSLSGRYVFQRVIEFRLRDGSPVPEEEFDEAEKAFKKFHLHCNILLELGLISDRRIEFDGYEDALEAPLDINTAIRLGIREVWPSRLTADGYVFLGNLAQGEDTKRKFLNVPSEVGIALIRQSVNVGLQELLSRLPI